MITPKDEYLSKLGQIQQALQSHKYFPIPESEKIYKIDLNTRTVEAPVSLSVTDDKEAEIIFFEVDRYYDFKDLAQTTCVIMYENANKEFFVYPVPNMDIVTKREEGKILLPWLIGSDVTWSAGTVKFSFQFYEINTGTLEFDYRLSTTIASTRVLQGMQYKYIEATEQAQKDYSDGLWATPEGRESYKKYFIKEFSATGHYRYALAKANFDVNATYYKREDEFKISDGTRIDAIYDWIQNYQKSSLKWVEI